MPIGNNAFAVRAISRW